MVLKLTDGTLFQSKALIGANVCESSSGSRVEVLDPATSQVLGTVPEMDSKVPCAWKDAVLRVHPGH